MIYRFQLACVHTLILWCCIFIACSDVLAEQKALLVGVGEYQIPNKDLPGIELDLILVQEALELIGFKQDQIQTLSNQQASYANIKHQFNNWLTEGISKNDRVVFYFSGHGTRIFDENGDEPDKADEVMMAHDAKLVRKNNRTTLDNVIVDDEFADWIKKIPSDNVYLFIDACNSGTATRSTFLTNKSLGVDQARFKFFYYEGMPPASENPHESSFITRELSSSNYVSLSATQDHEKALSTSVGSYFTLGINETIRNAVKNSRPLSMLNLQDHVQSFIKERVSKHLVYHPNLSGSESLSNEQFGLIKINNGYGPTWKKIDSLSALGKYIKIKSNKSKFSVGEEITINIDSPFDGYLNVIAIDSIDQSLVLYPNNFEPNNKISKGSIVIPANDNKFSLIADDPIGPTLIAAFISQAPINLYQLTTSGRNKDGIVRDIFSSLSAFGTRAISKVANTEQQDNFYSSSIVINIKN